MKVYYKLYLDEHTQRKKEEILERLAQNKWQIEVYLITLSKSEKNHLDIYDSALWLQKAIVKDEQFLVGIASGYNEALELVEMITKEVYDKTKGTDIKGYLIKQQEMFEESNQ